jgi:hypothetical protein
MNDDDHDGYWYTEDGEHSGMWNYTEGSNTDGVWNDGMWTYEYGMLNGTWSTNSAN